MCFPVTAGFSTVLIYPPGTRRKELLVGKVQLSVNHVALIREAAEKYCPVFSKEKLNTNNNRDKFMNRLGVALHEFHIKRTEGHVKSEQTPTVLIDSQSDETEVDTDEDDMQNAQKA